MKLNLNDLDLLDDEYDLPTSRPAKERREGTLTDLFVNNVTKRNGAKIRYDRLREKYGRD